MLKIAHRGASGSYPENTLLAFEKALELGANAIELDVHACKSGEAVVIHDRTLQRTTSGSGLVNRHTLEQLKTLDAGSGQTIPTLQEALLAIAPHATVFIEIKANDAVTPAAQIITTLAEEENLAYANMPAISYEKTHLTAVRQHNAQIICGFTPPGQPNDLTQATIETASMLGMWSVNPDIQHLQPSFVQSAQAAGLKVITWTANEPADIQKAKDLGVDGIMSDWPERL